MALFNKPGAPASHASNVAIVAAGAVFTGNIKLKCALHIDGEFEGDIDSGGIVLIGKSGLLKSKVRARKLIVAGKFFGNADCDAIELVNGGLVEGTLHTASLAIDKGAMFEGKSTRKKAPLAASPSRDRRANQNNSADANDNQREQPSLVSPVNSDSAMKLEKKPVKDANKDADRRVRAVE